MEFSRFGFQTKFWLFSKYSLMEGKFFVDVVYTFGGFQPNRKAPKRAKVR